MKRKANFDVLFAEGKKKKKRNKKFGFTGSNASSVTDAQLQSRWLERNTASRRASTANSYENIYTYIYMHLCMQTQAGTTVNVGLALRLRPLRCRLCCSVWTGYTERNQHPRRSQSFGYTMKTRFNQFQMSEKHQTLKKSLSY